MQAAVFIKALQWHGRFSFCTGLGGDAQGVCKIGIREEGVGRVDKVTQLGKKWTHIFKPHKKRNCLIMLCMCCQCMCRQPVVRPVMVPASTSGSVLGEWGRVWVHCCGAEGWWRAGQQKKSK